MIYWDMFHALHFLNIDLRDTLEEGHVLDLSSQILSLPTVSVTILRIDFV